MNAYGRTFESLPSPNRALAERLAAQQANRAYVRVAGMAHGAFALEREAWAGLRNDVADVRRVLGLVAADCLADATCDVGWAADA